MIILLFLRALRYLNFYNWDYDHISSTAFVLKDLEELKNIDLGQVYKITCVNRTTGQIHMEIYD